MSMITCRECRGQISNMATFCPRCGCPVQPESAPAWNPQSAIAPPVVQPTPAARGKTRIIASICALIIACAILLLAILYDTGIIGAFLPQTLDKTFTVQARGMFDYHISIGGPGRLYGYWTSAGRSARIPGATDDTLASYDLRGPQNRVILEQRDRPLTANFDFHTDIPGVYTFEFFNNGLLRNSARNIDFHGTFQPDW